MPEHSEKGSFSRGILFTEHLASILFTWVEAWKKLLMLYLLGFIFFYLLQSICYEESWVKIFIGIRMEFESCVRACAFFSMKSLELPITQFDW